MSGRSHVIDEPPKDRLGPSAEVCAPLHLDGIIFSLQRQGGISVYFRELVTRLARDRIPTRLLTYEPRLAPTPGPNGLAVVPHRSRVGERYRRCRLSGPVALFHSSYYRLPAPATTPSVVTVHDFTYERYRCGPARWVHVAQKRAAIQAAQGVICVSEATRRDLLRFIGVRSDQTLRVVYNGASDAFYPTVSDPPERPFLLFVGQRGGYKNFATALRALARLPDFDLRCVGGGALSPGELEGVSRSVSERVQHLGNVQDRELNMLYNRATCLVYPSDYEGFGIPILEAMQAGCPVVCSPCEAVLEVGGDALTVTPSQDDAALAHAVTELASSARRAEVTRAGLERAQEFSWERAYRETVAVYDEIASPWPAIRP